MDLFSSLTRRTFFAPFFAALWLAGMLTTAAIAAEPAFEVVARDPAGHGLVWQMQGKNLMVVEGTPEEMGAAHGAMLARAAKKLAERAVYVVGAADTLTSGTWYLDRMEEIRRRTTPYIPPRFLAECDAMSKAAGISTRDGRYANLLPERFHCTGVALCGKATRDGRVLHARVLDYMRDIQLQDAALVGVFIPQGRHTWMTLGYAGFIGTVTAMNEKGLAIGEMGGGGQGHWDGMPMSFLLRDVMERAANVEEALEILRRSPRTCQYYYVLSDPSRAMAAVEADPQKLTVLRPGDQDPRLPLIPDDVVLISGRDRAEVLCQRIRENYGRIDATMLTELIKRPVAMSSNLHDAVFSPETQEMWFADAGRDTNACDEPYHRVSLPDLVRRYREAGGSASSAIGGPSGK
jgi:hypothetical protein